MRMVCWIQADMRYQGEHLPEWVGKTSYRGDYTPARDSHLLHPPW